MKKLLLSAIIVSACARTFATQVVDTFDPPNSNPNQWFWLNSQGSFGTVDASGGNPGGWLDSGDPYHSDHPNLTSVAGSGTQLRVAMDSGELAAAQFDFKRMDPGPCFPQANGDSFALDLFDLHSDPGGSVIDAFVHGPPSPDGPSDWETVFFSIPFAANDVPDGWTLNVPPGMNYGWRDLMHNVDGISFYSIAPDAITFSVSCWHLGADNVVVTYGDEIFSGTFE